MHFVALKNHRIVIFFSFNLPIVQANLSRLVGTHEVKLNDHQFMMDLRTRILNDFDEKLTDKVRQREVKMHALLVTTENCTKFILLLPQLLQCLKNVIVLGNRNRTLQTINSKTEIQSAQLS